jgi:hypothetical protein
MGNYKHYDILHKITGYKCKVESVEIMLHNSCSYCIFDLVLSKFCF